MNKNTCLADNNIDNFVLQKAFAMGRSPVYLADDIELKQQVVIKTFPYSTKIESFYMREKTLFQFLKHKNIITLYKAKDNALLSKTNFESNNDSLPCRDNQPNQQKISYLVMEYALYGDLHRIIIKSGPLPRILARTVFHCLVDVVEFMHGKYISHMDLKCENLLIDTEFNLRVIDFDLSQSHDTLNIISGGTLCYRCPELIKKESKDLKAIDIYSMGVILFILISGHPPYVEYHTNSKQGNYDGYYRLLRSKPDLFWEAHLRSKGCDDFYSEDFRQLFISMVEERPEKRINISDIKKSGWYNDPVLNAEEYKIEMDKYIRGI